MPERSVRPRLVLAVLAGVLASGAAVGLLATAAWLITTAAEQPPVLTLLVAIVAVRAFGVGRGFFRYVERLAAHDAAYRVLGETRSRMTQRLEELAPAGLGSVRSGDLLARLLLDVDAVLDLWLRVILPVLVASVTALATVGLLVVLLPTAGAAVAIAVGLACTVVPWLTAYSARRAERAIAGRQGRGCGGRDRDTADGCRRGRLQRDRRSTGVLQCFGCAASRCRASVRVECRTGQCVAGALRRRRERGRVGTRQQRRHLRPSARSTHLDPAGTGRRAWWHPRHGPDRHTSTEPPC